MLCTCRRIHLCAICRNINYIQISNISLLKQNIPIPYLIGNIYSNFLMHFFSLLKYVSMKITLSFIIEIDFHIYIGVHEYTLKISDISISKVNSQQRIDSNVTRCAKAQFLWRNNVQSSRIK